MRALLSVLALLALTACSLVDAQVRIAVAGTDIRAEQRHSERLTLNPFGMPGVAWEGFGMCTPMPPSPWVAPDQQSLQEEHPTPPGPAPAA